MENYQIQRQSRINSAGIVQVRIRVPFQDGSYSKMYYGSGLTLTEATQVAINQHQVTGDEIKA
jgi:hypothetical protein